MKNLVLALLLASAPAFGAVAGKAPVLGGRNFGQLTGAITRNRPDPGRIKRMWVVTPKDEPEALVRIKDSLERIKLFNPEVEIVYKTDEDVFDYVGEPGQEEPDEEPAARVKLTKMLKDDGVEFVLASDPDNFFVFRGLRDSNLVSDLAGGEIAFGFAGRRYVSVDNPRESLNPEALSDPRAFPHRRFLDISKSKEAVGPVEGMQGERLALDQLLASAKDLERWKKPSLKDRLIYGLAWISGQRDNKEQAKERAQAERLAEYLDRNEVDVLSTSDPDAARLAHRMKEMGLHTGLPVLWTGKKTPPVADAINRVVPQGERLENAIAAAPKIERLPYNFMEMGGVSVRDYEPKVAQLVEKAVGKSGEPSSDPFKLDNNTERRYDVHLMLTGGNGVFEKSDGNAFGHFGMAVTDEKGKAQVWTVQYLNGGSFTGGVGDIKQMTLAEYLYSLWYLPGAVGQASPSSETGGARVIDIVLKNAITEAGLEAMRNYARIINRLMIMGKISYKFERENCIWIITQLLKAAKFAVAESDVETPGDKAFEFIQKLSRWIVENKLSAKDYGLVVFERPTHGGSDWYRIENTPLASPYHAQQKGWFKHMTWGQRLWRTITWIGGWKLLWQIPPTIERFAAMATHRMVVGPNSRELEIVENAESPIAKARAARQAAGILSRKEAPLAEEHGRLDDEISREEAGIIDGVVPAPGSPKPELPQDEASVKARAAKRARFQELSHELSLTRVDRQLAEVEAEYQELRFADVSNEHPKRFARIREAREKANDYRARMVREKRALTEKEAAVLHEINADVEMELKFIRTALRLELGPGVPHDMRIAAKQASLEDIEALVEARVKAAQAKGKGGKKSADGVLGKIKELGRWLWKKLVFWR